jgi:opacity protein-like surface antigen
MTLAGFGEMNMGAGHVWGELALVSYQDSKNKASGAKTKLGKETNVTVGYAYHFSEMVTGLAAYEYSMVSGNERLGSDKDWNEMTWTLGARIGF